MNRLALIVAALGITACYQPPAAPGPQRSPTPVAASFARTWDAVIGRFAEQNIPLHTLDRASGFAATDPLGVTDRESTTWADCGTATQVAVPPEYATYTVLVHGDSASSTVLVTVRWTAMVTHTMATTPTSTLCTSLGVWEAGFEQAVKQRAEHR